MSTVDAAPPSGGRSFLFEPGPIGPARGDAPVLSLFGLRMRRARLAAGWTARQVLERTGIHPANLYRIEHGRRYLAEETIELLAALYRVDVARLVQPGGGEPAIEGHLSAHLSEAEFIAAQSPRFANRNRMIWRSRADLRENARWFAAQLFEPVRALLDVPLQVVGGYRAQDTHRLILIDGTEVPGHTHGLAIDVVPEGLGLGVALERIAEAAGRGELEHLDFATVECGRWLHIQAPTFNRVGRMMTIPAQGE